MNNLDRIRAAADRARRAVEDLREYTVTIRLRSYASAIGEGVAATGDEDLVISPKPHVSAVSAERAAMFGGGPLVSSTGQRQIRVYTVRVSRSYTVSGGSGGYDLEQLVQASSSPAERPLVMIAGEEIGTVAEAHEIVDVRRGAATWYLTVRTRQL